MGKASSFAYIAHKSGTGMRHGGAQRHDPISGIGIIIKILVFMFFWV